MAAIGKIAAAIGEEEGHSSQLGLCDLPDEILIRILSLLPTEDAVRTCLLVLRRTGQHHLWKSLTSLQFYQDDDFFRRGGRRRIQFYQFVDIVTYLHYHSMPLVSFSLRVYVELEDDLSHIKRWITKAVQWNVDELTLSIDKPRYIELTMANTPYRCIFGCQSLVKLVLDFHRSSFELITFNVPSSSICLPRLKYLKLVGVQFHDVELTKKLLSSPLLEELILDSCPWMFVGSIRVCFPKLQVLKIDSDNYKVYKDDDDDDDDDDNDDDEEEEEDSTKICIIGDNLKYFYYMGNLINEFRICASASAQLSKVEVYLNEAMPRDYALNCYNILEGLSVTQNLALSDYFLEGLQNNSELLDTIPIFECLTRLDIRVYEELCIDSLAMMKIYERCPHLECLNIGKLSHNARSPRLSPLPLCFQNHLKKILVHYYVPGDNEADAAMDVLLNSALVLEELIIYCKGDEEKDFHEGSCKILELQDRLTRRPRASKDCIISVRLYNFSIDWSMASCWANDHYYDDCYLRSMNAS